MLRFLAIGDFHIPRRAHALPAPLQAVAGAGGFDAVLCTGDLIGESVLVELGALARTVVAVAGNMDSLDLPLEETFRTEGWRIGVVHGSEVHPRGDPAGLVRVASRLRVDVLVNGHTHQDAVYARAGAAGRIVFVNPGSATGIPGGSGGSLTPSLAVLDLSPAALSVTVHRLHADGRVEAEQSVFPR